MAKERMPKKDYFAKRFREAIENGNSSKAAYYQERLLQEVAKCETPKSGLAAVRHEINGLVIYTL